MIIISSEGILLRRSNVLDKAQIERSVLYPVFYFGETEGNYGDENVMGLLMENHCGPW